MKIETSFLSIVKSGARALIPLLILGVALTASPIARAGDLPAGDGRRPQVSAIQRAVEANAQRVAYRERLALRKQDAATLSQARDRVGVTLNSAAQTSSTIFFFDNAEGGLNGWTTVAYTGADVWHQTTVDASSPFHSWWPGVEIGANYDNGARVNAAAITPAINLSTAIAPVSLLFTENFYTEMGWDYCMVDVSTDGGSSWTPLRGEYGTAPTGDTEGWRITTLDLSSYAGATINIRFHFDTGDPLHNDFPGWFVDDVMVFDQGGRIAGKKFFDANDNGVKEPHERGISDWLITAAGPVNLTTRTDYRGRYRLTLPLGSYTVAEVPQAGWTQTYPPSGTWPVDLSTPDTLVDSVHFGNWRPATFITGVKFHDLNRNGFRDGGDTLLGEWKVTLTDTNGVAIRFDVTDSLGAFSIPVYEPGTYKLYEADRPFWVQTYPPTETWTVGVADVNSTIPGKDFGNYYSDSVNSIFGRVFDDQDRNGVSGDHEPGVSGFTVKLGGTRSRLRVSDDSGYFSFVGLPAGPYKVEEFAQDGWWRSLPVPPESAYYPNLTGGMYIDSVDFGNYQIATSSISGTKWNDLNGNGVRDPGEPGIPNWKVNLSGKSDATAYTDANGDYVFTGLWPGEYVVSESWRDQWRQTFPTGFGTWKFPLGPEALVWAIDFGNVSDTLFSAGFRTFSSESLALGKDLKHKTKPVPLKPDKVEFAAVFVNAETTGVSILHIRFNIALRDSLAFDKPGVLLIGAKNRLAEITLTSPLTPGDSVTVSGFGAKPILESVRKWWWTRSNLTLAPAQFTTRFTKNVLRLPMPNTINLLAEVGAGLQVGSGPGHMVLHPNYKAVIKSLVETGDRMHIGVPRCLDRFEGATLRPIVRQQKYLQPKRHNNVLFAEAIAFKANIRGSDNKNMPPGFGDLIYDEGTGPAMPLNDLSLRTIGAYLDKYMSSFPDTAVNPTCVMVPELAGIDADTLYDRIRRINRAFEGPIDTVSFSTGLMFTGVRPIDSVSFLRYDTSAAMRPFSGIERAAESVPDEFELSQNYPNPFNPTTTIEYYLPEDSRVTIVIYNTLGQVMGRLVDGEVQEAGYRDATFDASAYSSGVYFYRLSATTEGDGGATRSFTTVRKMVLMR
jgi:hypothetical protein